MLRQDVIWVEVLLSREDNVMCQGSSMKTHSKCSVLLQGPCDKMVPLSSSV